jgi:hypothetical protein
MKNETYVNVSSFSFGVKLVTCRIQVMRSWQLVEIYIILIIVRSRCQKEKSFEFIYFYNKRNWNMSPITAHRRREAKALYCMYLYL